MFVKTKYGTLVNLDQCEAITVRNDGSVFTVTALTRLDRHHDIYSGTEALCHQIVDAIAARIAREFIDNLALVDVAELS